MRVIGTAGHVDHGKSSLVEALTGIDPDRLREEKEREITIVLVTNLTQQALADKVNLHVIQIRRYERGSSQPTLEVIRRLAVVLSVSSDTLVFEADERGPGEDLRLQFEAIQAMDDEDKKVDPFANSELED